ncbi:phage tail protein [Nakamurella multipartita]|jgi:phage tail-like protein|uniref:Phage tail protein n=1 Tax=Nakamurella multipartita (strain ATCC 700099 / DSM 44233 / CIP 104796 / JCM 9543 / NBRC 105858 / Y-104) TaxID=479431 RepID=C8XH93_NAKMY|nr:phage tail protein [Nakamurella multipartita]ACV78299.1 phage tail protein [Nakamurella multipartita DSM 44233]HOZ56801.1 phage tail protein [Nakamurella multipartita]
MTRGLVPGLASPYPIGATLPAVFLGDSFTQRWCAALDEVLAPIITTLDSLPAYLDPATAPEDMLPWLAGWMGIALDGHQSAERQRELVQIGVELLQWRGTARGIRAAVRALFDLDPELIESGGTGQSTEPGSALPGTDQPELMVRLRVPNPEEFDVRRLDALVDMAKPAHIPHRVEITG